MIFFFLRPAERIVHVPDELDLGVVGLGPELQKNTLEIGTGAISLSFSASSIAGSWLSAGEQMREGACASAPRRPRPVPHCRSRAPCTTGRPCLRYIPAVAVIDVDALAALDHQRTGLAKRRDWYRDGSGFDIADREIAERRPLITFNLFRSVGLTRVRFAPRGARRGSGTSSSGIGRLRLSASGCRRRIGGRLAILPAFDLELRRGRLAHIPLADFIVVAAFGPRSRWICSS